MNVSLECVSLNVSLYYYMSLSLWSRPTKKILMNVRLECFHDCTGLVLNMRHLSIVGVCLFLIFFDSINIHLCLLSCGQQRPVRFWWIVKFAMKCLIIKSGANCYVIKPFTIWPNYIVKQKAIVRPWSVTSLLHEVSPDFLYDFFLNIFILISAWSHSVNNLSLVLFFQEFTLVLSFHF